MLLHIDDNKLIADVQEDFSDSYPFLKIEFYEQPHPGKGTPATTHRISPDVKIGAIRNMHHPGNLEIFSWYKTSRVQREFKEKSGLNVQVFRREAGAWVQTGESDSYTLAEQVARAKQAVVVPKKQRIVEYEYL